MRLHIGDNKLANIFNLIAMLALIAVIILVATGTGSLYLKLVLFAIEFIGICLSLGYAIITLGDKK